MSHRRTRSASIALAGVLLAAGVVPASGQPPAPDPIREWNAIMVATVAGQNPFAQGRFAAITQLAVFDAVNAIERRYTRTCRAHSPRRVPRRQPPRWRPRTRCS